MQIFLAKTKNFITFTLVLLVGCADMAVIPSPTPIAANTARAVSTPTSAFTTSAAAAPSSGETATPSALNATPTLKAADASPTPPEPTPFAPSLTSIGDPYTPELGNSGYDVQQYVLQMALDPAVTNIEATVTIEALASQDSLDELALDFIGFEITSLQVNNSEAVFRREDDKLLITPPQPLAMDETFNLTISYRGPPEKRPSNYVGFASSLGMTFVTSCRSRTGLATGFRPTTTRATRRFFALN